MSVSKTNNDTKSGFGSSIKHDFSINLFDDSDQIIRYIYPKMNFSIHVTVWCWNGITDFVHI